MTYRLHFVTLGTWLLASTPALAVGTTTTTLVTTTTTVRPSTTTTTIRPSTTTTTTLPLPDADGDGVPDVRDKCPGTPHGEIVDRDGCSIAQLCPCDAPRAASAWRSHGQYTSCFRHAVIAFRKAHLLTPQQAQAAMQSAGKTQCGAKAKAPRPGRTRCCRTHAGVAAKPFCLQVSKPACAKRHGIDLGPGSCLPNPCR